MTSEGSVATIIYRTNQNSYLTKRTLGSATYLLAI